MFKQVLDEAYRQEWNACVSHPLQSWEWGKARKNMGVEVVRLGQFESERLINGYQLTFHSIPLTPYTIAYLPRSVIPDGPAISELRKIATTRNAICIKCEPDVYWAPEYPLAPELKPSSYSLFAEWTQTISLAEDEKTLLSGLKPKTRYNVRLAQKKGVVVREMNSMEGFGIFSKLYFETCARQRYHGHTPAYHHEIWKTLSASGISHLLIAFYKDNPLCAYHLFHFNSKLYYVYGGSSLLHKEVMAPNLIMWESILLGKQLGATEFDMWGSLAPDYLQTHPWAGFTRFKEGYGTQFRRFLGTYDIIIQQPAYAVFSLAQKARSALLRLQ